MAGVLLPTEVTEMHLKIPSEARQARFGPIIQHKANTVLDQMLNQDNEEESSDQQEGLLKMPAKVLIAIFEKLDSGEDKVCLALSCRKVLRVAAKLDPIPILSRGNSVVPFARQQRLLAFLVRLRRTRDGHPPDNKIKLCQGRNCLRYRPCNGKGYWADKKPEWAKLWAKWNRAWEYGLDNWLLYGATLCPECSWDMSGRPPSAIWVD